MSHLAKLYVDGAEIDLIVYLKRRSFANCRCSNKTGITKCFETLFDYFEEKIDYGKIRLALAILEKRMLYIKPTL
jgi:ATP-dependent DNA helicase RecQ